MQVKVFAIRSGDAQARAEMLRGLLGEGSNLVYPLRIAADLRTNSLIAVGASEDLEVIRGILARLDQPAAHREQGRIRADGRDLHHELVRTATRTDQSGISNPKIQATVSSIRKSRYETPTMPSQRDLEEATLQLNAAKAELERLNEAYRNNPRAFSAAEMAKARLAARCAEIRVEKLNAVSVGMSR